jgi:hypothetical protein
VSSPRTGCSILITSALGSNSRQSRFLRTNAVGSDCRTISLKHTLDHQVFVCSMAAFGQLCCPIWAQESERTPASTLVISSTLMPASGPSPLVEGTEAKHRRRPGCGQWAANLRPVLNRTREIGLGTVITASMTACGCAASKKV